MNERGSQVAAGGGSARYTGHEPVMTLVRRHARTLEQAGRERPEVDALILARHALDLDPAGVRTARVRDLDREAMDRLGQLVARRAAGEPVQYLTGRTGFRDLSLTCRPGVFIPRPETEQLADAAIEAARAAVAERGRAVVLEPCTGTGAIALAVATTVPGAAVVATDRSAAAVRLARENLSAVERHPGLAAATSVTVLGGDLMGPVPQEIRGAADVLVANPPYLEPAEVAAAGPDVRDHEPRGALVGGPDGDAVVDRLLREGRTWLRAGGTLLLEVSERRARRAAANAGSLGYVGIELDRDLAGRDRVLRALAPGGATTGG